jgi:hypothetical protein
MEDLRGVKGQEVRTVAEKDDDMLFRWGRMEGGGVVLGSQKIRQFGFKFERISSS